MIFRLLCHLQKCPSLDNDNMVILPLLYFLPPCQSLTSLQKQILISLTAKSYSQILVHRFRDISSV